ncbi:hypothetical protein TNCV_5063091 [Trichonephila clavipes]|nr:hypothetical protein TNCV_5063091 [Trichonephila clavipes]
MKHSTPVPEYISPNQRVEGVLWALITVKKLICRSRSLLSPLRQATAVATIPSQMAAIRTTECVPPKTRAAFCVFGKELQGKEEKRNRFPMNRSNG